jgi:hypothetical protein
MATILVTPLPAVAFSKNRIMATFQTDSVYASLGVLAINEFELTGTIFIGRTIQIRYGTVTVNLLVVTSSPPTGNNIKSGNGTLAHAQSLIPYFQSNAYLNRDFVITVPNDPTRPRVVFTAKNIGPDYNFIPIIYTNISLLNATAGAGQVRKKNLAIALECQVQRIGSSDYDTVYAERIPYRSQQVSINISKLLHAELAPDFPAAWDTATPWKHTRSRRKYRLVTAEGYGDPFVLQAAETFPEKIAKMGGTGFRQGFTKTPTEWVQGAAAADDKFLRYGVNFRHIQTDEPQWLSFLNTRTAITNLYIEAVIVFGDNSTQTTTTLIAGGLAVNECITIPAWITALSLHIVAPTKAIKTYALRLLSGSNYISEQLMFALDTAHREHKQYFVFLNSLGVWDSFLAYGQSSYGVSWANQQIQRPIPHGYTTNDGDLSDVGSSMRDTFAVATSFYTADQLRYLRDFFGSPYKYRWISGKCYPISIKAKDLAEGSDGQNQFAHTFEYQFAYQNQSFD